MNEQSEHRRMTSVEYRRKHWRQIQSKEAIAKAFEDRGHWNMAQKIRACCNYEELVCCRHCGNRWWVMEHCDLRCCPICAHKTAIRRSRAIMALAETAKAPKMLTLTMPRWQGKVRDGIKRLRNAIIELRKTNLLQRATAGAYTIELVPKKDGWHIHAHMIVDCEYIPFKKLVAAWSHCIKVKGAHCRVQGASAKAVQAYICKYACKAGADGLTEQQIVDWYEATKGSRLWATWGKWFGKAAAAIVKAAADARPQSACPYCGAIHSVFFACCGKAVWGEDWHDIADAFTGGIKYERRCIDEMSEYIDSLKEEVA